MARDNISTETALLIVRDTLEIIAHVRDNPTEE